MSKTKAFTCALLGGALLVSLSGVAGAGGGGTGSGPFADVFLSDCYRVAEGDKNDDNKAAFTLDITHQLGHRQNVRGGGARLVCGASGPCPGQAGPRFPPLNRR